MQNQNNWDTIVAPATPHGQSAVAVIRISGKEAFQIVKKIWKGKELDNAKTHTLHFGKIVDSNNEVVDEVLLSIFRAPHSFTMEDSIEISTHGSPYIVQRVLSLLVEAGARIAEPGEFTKRAYLNGRFDLVQAEAVADLIASQSSAAHRVAMQQMRGRFSSKIKQLREQLIHFASLLELELDFSEEDVEFADRTQLLSLLSEIKKVVHHLKESYKYGNVLKRGVPVAIVGKPNAGKSTLLNALLQEERAIVSDIAGTTRDVIEDEITIEGITFRFIDTAGIRETSDTIEAIGVERARQKMKEASIILYLFDVNTANIEEVQDAIQEIENLNVSYILLGNKIDMLSEHSKLTAIQEALKKESQAPFMFISAKNEKDVENLKSELLKRVQQWEASLQTDIIVTNARHYEFLEKAEQALSQAEHGLLSQLPSDLVAMDVRATLHFLGEITGEITTEDLLGNIFSKFCIGK
ncbi:tRNA modification GTPase [Thermonema lapsum]|uniref:tRNA modification GTPase MnmE n=1 Tax=Thermonema lapsum TaxID=28195 RepID=A0A846MN36_9BACT|nr:tRNA uridine-5-carboxymethylaminomethyl(34) synthesis GTPase MnmE [Thermonema lapsum]NIK72871.1 tRNA modification GTPase [Thermonema lapsum]